MRFSKHFETERDWHAFRFGGIGSSDAAAIMGESEWSSPIECVLAKIGVTNGRIREPYQYKAMEKGKRLEPFARRSYEAWSGILMPAVPMIHPAFPQLRATFDGLNREENRALEIKCPGKKAHSEAVKGEIPKRDIWQCVHLLMVSGMEWLDFYSYYEDPHGLVDERCVSLKRNFKLENELMKAELEAWEIIVKYRRQKTNVLQFRR